MMADAEAGDDGCASHYCPWNQTLPWVLKSAPGLEAHAAEVPHADAAFPPGTGADQEGPGRDHAAPGRDAARERPRGGRGLHGAAQVSANA